jgi:hypothetical protein
MPRALRPPHTCCVKRLLSSETVGPIIAAMHIMNTTRDFRIANSFKKRKKKKEKRTFDTLLDFYSYRLIGKLTAFLQLQEFNQCNQTWGHRTLIFAARRSLR